MVLLTTNPNGRLLHSLASIIHESLLGNFLVLPCNTFMELAGIQMASWALPTHTWPNTASEPELGSFFLASELILEVFTLMESELWLADSV